MDNAAYYVAGIDIHKRILAVVVANARDREQQFEGRRFGTTISELQKLSTWLQERAVQEVVMESTAQYWKPVWFELEGQFQLWLAQARSNRGPRGRKTLVLFRRRALGSRVKRNGDWGARSKKPSEGSRWRGGRGPYANWMGQREVLKFAEIGRESEEEAGEGVGTRVDG